MSASIIIHKRPTLAELNQKLDAAREVRETLTKAYWQNSASDNGEAFQAWLAASDAYDTARDAVVQRHDQLRAFECEPGEVEYLIVEAASHGVIVDARLAKDMLFCEVVAHEIQPEISPWEEDAHLSVDAEHSDAQASFEKDNA